MARLPRWMKIVGTRKTSIGLEHDIKIARWYMPILCLTATYTVLKGYEIPKWKFPFLYLKALWILRGGLNVS